MKKGKRSIGALLGVILCFIFLALLFYEHHYVIATVVILLKSVKLWYKTHKNKIATEASKLEEEMYSRNDEYINL